MDHRATQKQSRLKTLRTTFTEYLRGFGSGGRDRTYDQLINSQLVKYFIHK